jgi:hypothetical protein
MPNGVPVWLDGMRIIGRIYSALWMEIEARMARGPATSAVLTVGGAHPA